METDSRVGILSKGEIHCSVCRQWLPVSWSDWATRIFDDACTHVLCAECIEKIQALPGGAEQNRCPVCKKRPQTTESKKNPVLEELEEALAPNQDAKNTPQQPQPCSNSFEAGVALQSQSESIDENTLHIALVGAPVSDSGYETLSHLSVVRLQPEATLAEHNGRVVKTSPDDVEDGFDDTRTMYSDAASLSGLKIAGYTAALADDLSGKLSSSVVDGEVVERLFRSLPRLLRAFALKLGQGASSHLNRDLMYFIHKHRNDIADEFKGSLIEEIRSTGARNQALPETLRRWLESADGFERPPGVDIPQNGEQDFEELEEVELPSLAEYSQLIFDNVGYVWLLDQLRKEIRLSTHGEDSIGDIRSRILQGTKRMCRISRHRSPREITIFYFAHWDLLSFLSEQGYDEPNHVAFAKVITLTGSSTDSQALGCGEYLAQTWPTTGSHTKRVIQELLRSPDQATQREKSPCGVTISASFSGPVVIIEAWGIPEFVAEIGEQLAWLGSALRMSPFTHGVACCTPSVDLISPLTPYGHVKDTGEMWECNMRFNLEQYDSPAVVNGQCWHAMFSQPVLARGFPIPQRPRVNTGLELPLNMAAALTQTKYVNVFQSKVFIKGFSTMLVPTERIGDMVVWHLIYNRHPNERISYLDCNVEHTDVQLIDLEQCQHVVGWCSEAVCNIGGSDANYDVKKSGLPGAGSECRLEGAELHAGQFVTGTAVFSLGKREKPIHISRPGYFTKLQWISRRYVVLWDEDDKAGWLVNGASALLHLVRGSLEHTKGIFKSAFLLDLEQIPDIDRTRPESAMEILADRSNRVLKLYADKTEPITEITVESGQTTTIQREVTAYYTLEDRVEHIYDILEKLIDHQADAEKRDGLRVKPRPRGQLEGWDFKDIAKDGDPFTARVATLHSGGKTWVDFTRKIRAVTLLGRGFGELIHPQNTSDPGCAHWRYLPRGNYYLTIHLADLKAIMDDNDDNDDGSSPRTLCGNLLWDVNPRTFQGCPCASGRPHHVPVQALLPNGLRSKFLKKRPPIDIPQTGAVIFGQSMSVPWHWEDYGDPIQGDSLLKAPSQTASDSGIGTSIGSPKSSSHTSLRSMLPWASRSSGQEDSSTTPDGEHSRVEASRTLRHSGRRLKDAISSIGKRVYPKE